MEYREILEMTALLVFPRFNFINMSFDLAGQISGRGTVNYSCTEHF